MKRKSQLNCLKKSFPVCLAKNLLLLRIGELHREHSFCHLLITVTFTSISFSERPRIYSFSVEECIVQTHANRHVNCPRHGDIHLAQLAPDTVRLKPLKPFILLLKLALWSVAIPRYRREKHHPRTKFETELVIGARSVRICLQGNC